MEVPAGSDVLDAAGVGDRHSHALLLAAVRAVDSCLVCLVKICPAAASRRPAPRRRPRAWRSRAKPTRSSRPPQRAGTALERSPGRLPGPVLVRLPGADEHPADAAPDCRRRAARGRSPSRPTSPCRPCWAGSARPLAKRSAAAANSTARWRSATQADRGRRDWLRRSPICRRVGRLRANAWRLSAAGQPAWPRPATWPKAAMPARSSTTATRWAVCLAAKSRAEKLPREVLEREIAQIVRSGWKPD